MDLMDATGWTIINLTNNSVSLKYSVESTDIYGSSAAISNSELTYNLVK
jgi:hypothetical protein